MGSKIMDQQSKSMQNIKSRRQPSDLFVQRDIKSTARLLYELVDATDRKYRHQTYTNCWIGKEAVTAMMENNLCLHRKHGVALCRQMEDENLIHHVLYENGGKFVDSKHAFYQFTIDDKRQTRQRIFSDLDVEFGLIHKIETKQLIEHRHFMKNQQSKRVLDDFLAQTMENEQGILPKFTKLPSAMLQEMNLTDFQMKKIRKRSTMTRFKSMQKEYVDLPEFSGWMEKKSASGLKSWQKRWIIVRRTHILWAKTMIDTANPLNPKERKKFNNSMTLLTIKEVRPVNSKRKRKFDIITPAKTYHFKCQTAEQRDVWLNGLDAHMNALSASMTFLRKSIALNGINDDE